MLTGLHLNYLTGSDTTLTFELLHADSRCAERIGRFAVAHCSLMRNSPPPKGAGIATLGVAHAAFSSDFAANARAMDPSQAAPDFEQVIEAGYSAVLSAHVTLTPDLQYIRHPGGCAERGEVIAFLLRLKASY